MSRGSALQPLKPIYVVSGDEILLHIEQCDAIRAAAQQQGYTERHRYVMDARSDWATIFENTQALSLFGDKRFIDISLATGKPGRTGAEAIGRLCEQSQSDDQVLLFQLPRLDRATRNSKWVKQLQQYAQWIEVPSIHKTNYRNGSSNAHNSKNNLYIKRHCIGLPTKWKAIYSPPTKSSKKWSSSTLVVSSVSNKYRLPF